MIPHLSIQYGMGEGSKHMKIPERVIYYRMHFKTPYLNENAIFEKKKIQYIIIRVCIRLYAIQFIQRTDKESKIRLV